MLHNKLSQKYGKREFYAKIEPDNYMSQFLFEKLRAIPVGLAKDFQICNDSEDKFIETHRNFLDENIQNIAKNLK